MTSSRHFSTEIMDVRMPGLKAKVRGRLNGLELRHLEVNRFRLREGKGRT
jgi:hypothetical protein